MQHCYQPSHPVSSLSNQAHTHGPLTCKNPVLSSSHLPTVLAHICHTSHHILVVLNPLTCCCICINHFHTSYIITPAALLTYHAHTADCIVNILGLSSLPPAVLGPHLSYVMSIFTCDILHLGLLYFAGHSTMTHCCQ